MEDLNRAVRDALATYLAAELTGAFPGLVVSSEWPTGPLPALALTVLAPGTPDVTFFPPEVASVTPGAAPNGTVRFCYGEASLGLQLDAWATAQPARDALAAATRDALNRHPAVTLGTPTPPRLGRRGGLVLKIAALLDAPCDLRFAPTPLPVEDADAAAAGEWRATWTGSALLYLMDAQQVALLKTLTVTTTVTP